MDHSQPPDQSALLAEELSSDEVRELLERLNARDFGGSENATVGAIVDATGSDAVIVGRLLAEIRKEDFEERFGLRLTHSEKRIETLEERAKRLESVSRQTIKYERAPAVDPYREAALNRLAEQERQREEARPVAIVFAVLILLIAFVAAAGKCDAGNATASPSISVGTVNGGWIEDGKDGHLIVREKDGSTRQPTEEEKSDYAAMAMAQLSEKKR